MLTQKQIKLRNKLLSPVKQWFYYANNLPMGIISGIRLVQLDEEKSVATVPYRWWNKNPFDSMYFSVQSMAAELSTAAPALLALESVDAAIAFIIVDLKAEFVKKAKSGITFTCCDYHKYLDAVSWLDKPDDATTVTVKTVGRDVDDDEVAIFYFTWSFKRRS